MLRTHQLRSDLQATSVSRSSGAAVWTNTKEASPTTMVVPMSMLMFNLNSAGSMTLAGSRPVQRATPKSPEAPLPSPVSDTGTALMTLVEELPGEPEAALPEVPDVGEALEAPEPEPLSADRGQVEREPPTAAEAEPASSVETHRIELIIDQLTRHELIETIPVTVESLGDKVFTATVGALNLTGTGNTLGDALLIVKDQLEIIYDKLSKTTRLDGDEEKYLKYLQSHIRGSSPSDSRPPKKSVWR